MHQDQHYHQIYSNHINNFKTLNTFNLKIIIKIMQFYSIVKQKKKSIIRMIITKLIWIETKTAIKINQNFLNLQFLRSSKSQ